MNQRDELADLIESMDGHFYTDIADEIRAAGYSRPQVVESVEGLEALPVGSVVLTEQGGVYELAWQETWMETGDHNPHGHEDLSLPATVLYAPQEAE